MASLLSDMMDKNKKKVKNASGMLVSKTKPLEESSAEVGLAAQPTDAVGASMIGATPKQQDMAGSQQGQQGAMKQAARPQTLQQTQRTQQTQPLPDSGDSVAAARNLIESARTAQQASLQGNVTVDNLEAPEAIVPLEQRLAGVTDPAEIAKIEGEYEAELASKAEGGTAFDAASDQYGDLQAESLKVADMFEPSELAEITAELGLPEGATLADMQEALDNYESQVTAQVDQAQSMANDPAAPPSVRAQARGELKEMGASHLLATDAELDALAERLETADEVTVEINGQPVTASMAEIFEDPAVEGHVQGFISEFTAADDAEKAKILEEYKKGSPGLEFLFDDMSKNMNAYEATLGQQSEEAKAIQGVITENKATKKELTDLYGDDILKDLGLTGLSTQSQSSELTDALTDPEISSILAKGISPQEFITAQKEGKSLEEVKQDIKKRGQELDRTSTWQGTLDKLNISEGLLQGALSSSSSDPETKKLIDADGDGKVDDPLQIQERLQGLIKEGKTVPTFDSFQVDKRKRKQAAEEGLLKTQKAKEAAEKERIAQEQHQGLLDFLSDKDKADTAAIKKEEERERKKQARIDAAQKKKASQSGRFTTNTYNSGTKKGRRGATTKISKPSRRGRRR